MYEIAAVCFIIHVMCDVSLFKRVEYQWGIEEKGIYKHTIMINLWCAEKYISSKYFSQE